MTSPRDQGFGDETPEADVVEQLIPVVADDEDGGLDPERIAVSSTLDASEADLIEQSIPVPLSDDDPELDR